MNKIDINEFKEMYENELNYIFNNYIKEFLEDTNLSIIDMKVLYYDLIKYFYLNSI